MAASSSSPSPSSSDDEVTASGVQQTQQDGSGDGLRRRGGAQKGEGSARRERGGARGGAKKHGGVALPKFVTDPENIVGWTVNGVQDFAVDSIRLVRRCTKPDAREFKKIAYACAVGFLLMGFTGYIVKLIFIPINNIIVGG